MPFGRTCHKTFVRNSQIGDDGDDDGNDDDDNNDDDDDDDNDDADVN